MINECLYALKDSAGNWYRREGMWHTSKEAWGEFRLDSLFSSKSLASFVLEDCKESHPGIELVMLKLYQCPRTI